MLDPQLIDRLGWTLIRSLIRSLGQLVLLAYLAAFGNRFLFRKSADARYLAGVLLAVFVGVWCNGLETVRAAELEPLHSSRWKAKAELKIDADGYLLGENVWLELGITNTQKEPLQISSGSDYRGAPRATRFKVLAFDADGLPVADPYPRPRNHGGVGRGARPLPPGETLWLPFPLGRYCDFQKPGVYTLRVYHDFGLDKESPLPLNELPADELVAPTAEAQITFIMPTGRQARRMVNRMADIVRNDESRAGWNQGGADFATLRQPIYLPHLLRLTNDDSEQLASAAVRGIAEIATPEATTALVELLDHDVTAVSSQAIFALVRRLPYPDLMQHAAATGEGERTRYLALRSWNGEHRDRLLEIARQLTATNRYGTLQVSSDDNKRHGLKIYQALGRAEDYPGFREHIEAALATNARMDFLVQQYADTAWTLFCNRAPQPPRDLAALLKITGEPDALTFLRLLTARPDYRPAGWEDRLADLLRASSPSVRLFATRHVPLPVSKKLAEGIARNITDEWGKSFRRNGELTLHPPLQIASLEVAEKTRSIFFLPSIRQAIEESENKRVRSVAERVLKACSRPDAETIEGRDALPSTTGLEFGQEDAAGQGALRGRFILAGKIPEQIRLEAQDRKYWNGSEWVTVGPGDAHKILDEKKAYDESLIVAKDGGVANVVVWVRDADIPVRKPRNEEPPPVLEPARIRFKDGRLDPHVLVMQSQQRLIVRNEMPVATTFHAQTVVNSSYNILLPPGRKQELAFPKAERNPASLSSNIHPWFRGYLLVRDNPYFAVSGADGRFEITNLPPGEWEFQFWHEKSGYLNTGVWPKGRLRVKIGLGATDLGDIKLTREDLPFANGGGQR